MGSAVRSGSDFMCSSELFKCNLVSGSSASSPGGEPKLCLDGD